MNRQYFLAIFGILALMVFIAGCTTKAPESTGQVVSEPQPQLQTPSQAEVPQSGQQPATIVNVFFLSSPASAGAGEDVIIEWKVDSNVQKSITHTAVHYGIVSYPGTFSTEVTPQDSGYPNLAGLVTSATIPNTFSAMIAAPQTETTLYYRAHAIVDGKNYWSDEKMIKVTVSVSEAPPEQMPAPPMSSGGGYGY